ncbi:hypothetical protein [Enterococcus mundtii]|uniref:hypothetical protein n=1 Tax=Enterococcus mundtii TaxID=53346 RepID=UPI0035C725AA
MSKQKEDQEGKKRIFVMLYKWHFEKDFTVTAEKSKRIKCKDVTVEKDNTWICFLIGGILLALLAFLFVLYSLETSHKGRRR